MPIYIRSRHDSRHDQNTVRFWFERITRRICSIITTYNGHWPKCRVQTMPNRTLAEFLISPHANAPIFFATKNYLWRTATSTLALAAYCKSAFQKAPSARAKAPKWRTERPTSTLNFTRKPGRIPITSALKSDDAIQR